MDIDPYQHCPCESGAKVKFCCCKDILPELGKAVRMIEGEQRLACLEHVNRTLAKHPGRAALQVIRCTLLSQLGRREEAEQAAEQIVKDHPDLGTAHAFVAIRQASSEGDEFGVDALQKALRETSAIGPVTFQALEIVAERLLAETRLVAARVLFEILSHVAEDDDRPKAVLRRLRSLPAPLVLRQPVVLRECSEDFSEKDRFQEAFGKGRSVSWLEALPEFEALAQAHPDCCEALYNVAVLNCYLVRDEEAARWLCKFAACEGVDHDDAVEAVALAQQLVYWRPLTPELEQAEGNSKATVLRQKVNYAIDDSSRAMELLSSSQQALAADVSFDELLEEDEPRPRAVYRLLDRPKLDEDAEVNLESAPQTIGLVLVYGKQTDRGAQIALTLHDCDLPRAATAMREILGEFPDESIEQENLSVIPRQDYELGWRSYLPDSLDVDRLEALRREHQRRVVAERLKETPNLVLGGKTPAEAVHEPALRLDVEAWVLNLELDKQSSLEPSAFEQLRESLGLESPPPIDPWTDAMPHIPTCRLHRVEAEKLEDIDLVLAYQNAIQLRAAQAVRVLGEEAFARESLADAKLKIGVAAGMASVAYTTAEALDWLARARRRANEANESPAEVLLEEFTVHYRRRDVDKAQEVLTEIQSKHLNEPGIGQRLYQILEAMGLISPPQAGPAASSASPEPEPSLAAAPPTGGVWTPDNPAQGAQPPGKAQSKIWMPGMD